MSPGDLEQVRRPLRRDARESRDKLVAAARAEFASRGVDASLEKIARDAGVSIGTLYRHFPTRDALIMAVYRDEVDTLCGTARTLRDSLPGDEALAAFLREFVDFVQARHGLAHTLAALMATRAEEFSEGSRELEQAVTDLVAAGVADGTLRDDITAGAVMVALHGVGGARDRPDWRAEADGVITLLVDGMRSL